MALFSFVVAPAAFAVLADRSLAGNVVSRVLGGVESIGIILGVFLVSLILFSREKRQKAFYIELSATVLMTVSMIVSRFVVSKQLHDLRVRYGDQLSALSQSDPARVAFDQLHQYSVWLMSFNIIVAVFSIVLLVRRNSWP